ncbi:MAG: CcdB family protein [Spirochaetota bacterium]
MDRAFAVTQELCCLAVAPFLLNVQSPFLDDLVARIVISLQRADILEGGPIPLRPTPLLTIEGISCMLDTPQIAAVPTRVLGSPVANLESEHRTIALALDFLFQGF